MIVLTLMLCNVASAKQLYVIGDPFGGWNPGNPVPMTLDADGITNTITISTEKTVWWTICDGADSDWTVFNSTYRYGVKPGDVEVAIGDYQLQKCEGTFKLAAGDYTVTVNSETMMMTIEGKKEDVVINVVSIVGELTGGWDAETNVLDLTDAGGGIWTGTITDFEATAKKYEWKAIANHQWGVFDLPSSGNYEYTFESDGIYDIEFSVDVNAQTAEISVTKKEDIVVEKDYYVAGQEALMGVDWDSSYEGNKMEKNEDGTYVLTFTATLTAGETYEFKVVTNGDWNQPSYGGDTDNGNYQFSVDETGEYEITIYFNPKTHEITIQLTNTSGIGQIVNSKSENSKYIYNLNGQKIVNGKLSNCKLPKGIYIVNGKKVAVK